MAAILCTAVMATNAIPPCSPNDCFALVPTNGCHLPPLPLCYQGQLQDVQHVAKVDPLGKICKSNVTNGTCAEHGYGKLFLDHDPVFTKTSVWKPNASSVGGSTQNTATEPYAGQTGAPTNSEFSSNCWTNVSLDGQFTGKRALVVTTSYGKRLDKFPPEPTGVAMEEAAEPYYVYLDAGMKVDIASIKGGSVPHEDQPKTPGVKRFLSDTDAMAKLSNSLLIDTVNFTDYDVVFMAGGWGAAFDLGYSVALGTRVAGALERGSPLIASVCHGCLGFVQANMSDGTPWVKGRKMTGVTDAQIKEFGITTQTPMHPEEELRALGADYQCIHGTGLLKDVGAASVSVDLSTKSPIVTGQNQVASCVTAQRQLLFLQWQHQKKN